MKSLPPSSALRREEDACGTSDNTSTMDRVVQQPAWVRRHLTPIVCALGILTASAFAYAAMGLNSSVTLERDRVATGAVGWSEFEEVVLVNGQVIPEHTVLLDSVEGGRITKVHVEEGQHVAEGTVLVTLQNTDLELQVMAREAQYTEQLSNLARSQIEFDRAGLQYAQQLADAGLEIELAEAELARYRDPQMTGIPRSVIERLETELTHYRDNYQLVEKARDRDHRNSQANLSQLRESVSRMKDSLDILRTNLGGLSVTAPIEGVVSDFDVVPGEVIAPGQRIGRVARTGQFKVRALADEFYLGRLSMGLEAEGVLNSQPVQMVVKKVYPSVEDRQFEFDLTMIDFGQQQVRIGQNIRTKVKLSEAERVLTLPNGSYLQQSGGAWVFVLSADGSTATRRDISTGRRNDRLVEVLSGLSPGEEVLTSNYDQLTDSVLVRLETS